MVSAEELTSEQHAELHADLTELKRQLTASIAAADERTGVVDLDQEIGRLSRMDALQHQKTIKSHKSIIAVRPSADAFVVIVHVSRSHKKRVNNVARSVCEAGELHCFYLDGKGPG